MDMAMSSISRRACVNISIGFSLFLRLYFLRDTPHPHPQCSCPMFPCLPNPPSPHAVSCPAPPPPYMIHCPSFLFGCRQQLLVQCVCFRRLLLLCCSSRSFAKHKKTSYQRLRDFPLPRASRTPLSVQIMHQNCPPNNIHDLFHSFLPSYGTVDFVFLSPTTRTLELLTFQTTNALFVCFPRHSAL